MSLNVFLQTFVVTAGIHSGMRFSESVSEDREFNDVINQLGGKTFDHGLYRVLAPNQIEPARDAMERAFPEFAGQIVPFGYDWLGRHFAVDVKAASADQQSILMLEVGAGEVMRIPANISDFHNKELVEHADAALSRSFFDEWRLLNTTPLRADQCVGYKVPLFLGGEDDIDNLEITDLSVYIEICGQLRNQVKQMKGGQKNGSIKIE